MIFNDLIALVPDVNTPIDEVRKAFFSSEVSVEDKKTFIEFLLSEGRFYQLGEIMLGGRIVKEYGNSDFISKQQSDEQSLQSRYFNLYMDIIKECGVSIDKVMPMFFAAPGAPADSLLRGWTGAIEGYFYKMATKNFEQAESYIFRFDENLRFVHILIKLDRKNTLEKLIELALSGGNISKTSAKKFLLAYKNEVFEYVRQHYNDLKIPERKEAVKLLQLFKNDPTISRYIDEVGVTETGFSVAKTLEGDVAPPVKKRNFSDLNFFYDAMVVGTPLSLDEFNELIDDAFNSEIAESLIFSVYIGGNLSSMVVVDNGEILDLNNSPIKLNPDSIIKVMHPVELSGKFAYLKQLQIVQPIEQLKRQVFLPSENDKVYNCCERLSGTIAAAPLLKNNIKTYGFKILNKDNDGICHQVGLEREGILCVLNFSPLDLTNPINKLVTAAEVKFYSYDDVIKLSSQIFVDGVTVYPIAKIEPRLFSEFLNSLYELLGCK